MPRTAGDAEHATTSHESGDRTASRLRPGVELTKRTLWSGLEAGNLEGHMQAEGRGQLSLRKVTANFEEAVAARAQNRSAALTDDT